jgi:hypothetical protein
VTLQFLCMVQDLSSQESHSLFICRELNLNYLNKINQLTEVYFYVFWVTPAFVCNNSIHISPIVGIVIRVSRRIATII